MFEITDIEDIIKNKDIEKFTAYMEQFKLVLDGDKLRATDPEEFKGLASFWDTIQLAQKVILNQTYGGLANPGSINFDQRLTQSCTLTGRCTTQHMGKTINEHYTGNYELGDTIIYGDSVSGDTIVRTSHGEMTIAELHDRLTLPLFVPDSGKEYKHPNNTDIMVIGYSFEHSLAIWSEINFTMKHKTNKSKYRIETETGNQVTLTGDHSVLICRDDEYYKLPPNYISIGDIVIILGDKGKTKQDRISKIEQLGNYEDEYVYDLSIKKNDTVFFGNDILVSNTDSNYFTVPDPMKDTLTKDSFIQITNEAGKVANASFAKFYKEAFNVDPNASVVIKCAREMCAESALFIKKKRYAAIVYDNKGVRYDEKSAGKLKITGLDIKRSDCPKWVQEKLQDTLEKVLKDHQSEDEVLKYIRDWRKEFTQLKDWEKGTPKRVNKLTYYSQAHAKNIKGVTIPGHVRAAINWNNMLELNHDLESSHILDGGKVIVCKLKPNKFGITSIAYPIDQSNLPEWFKNLPFDVDSMVEVAVDNKVENIFGLLGWNLNETKIMTNMDLFDYE